MSGRLYLVATPVGNLADLSPRAVDALREASTVLAEDTRRTLTLLRAYSIDTPLESFHEHNEDEKAARIVERIRAGDVIALVSDAGTPIVSDPGYPLLRRLRDERLAVVPIPGASAVMLALAASGLPPTPFAFWGFSPHRDGERRDFWARVASSSMTAVVFESPQRLVESLESAREILGDVEATVARELTKMHEELIHGRLSEIVETVRRRDSVRGEITLVLAAAERRSEELPSVARLREELERLRDGGMRRNDAVKALAARYGLSRNDLYKMLTGE
ncbi:MAG: 16S rRNA (cytidine(1402)-2'-O)-methyltransferase [Acidobacteria bacterium]|nr:16S rRNA (cytidine(1402)-2'-O)-methyltransferase [Acidobacteriota bacterium]